MANRPNKEHMMRDLQQLTAQAKLVAEDLRQEREEANIYWRIMPDQSLRAYQLGTRPASYRQLLKNPHVLLHMGGSQQQQNKPKQPAKRGEGVASRRMLLAPVALLLLGLFLILGSGDSASANAGGSTAASGQPPVNQVAAPEPRVTALPIHSYFKAPVSLNAGAVGIGAITIKSYVQDSPTSTLILGRDAPVGTCELQHYGIYPGEEGNIVLAGTLAACAGLKNLAINDTVQVTNRAGESYVYRLVPCNWTIKECLVDSTATWVLGRTPTEEIGVYLEDELIQIEKASELTLVLAEPAPTNQLTTDPTRYQNYVLRAKFIGIASPKKKNEYKPNG